MHNRTAVLSGADVFLLVTFPPRRSISLPGFPACAGQQGPLLGGTEAISWHTGLGALLSWKLHLHFGMLHPDPKPHTHDPNVSWCKARFRLRAWQVEVLQGFWPWP